MNFNIFRTVCGEIPVSNAIRLCETPPLNTRRRILVHCAMSLNIYNLLTPSRPCRAFPTAEAPAGAVTVVGKAVLGIAGAYLLRAIAESGRSEERRVGKECRSRWA